MRAGISFPQLATSTAISACLAPTIGVGRSTNLRPSGPPNDSTKTDLQTSLLFGSIEQVGTASTEGIWRRSALPRRPWGS
jgi:hypothetical protein